MNTVVKDFVQQKEVDDIRVKIFDLDDTQLICQANYTFVINKFKKEMEEFFKDFSLTGEESHAVQQDIDKELVKRHGYQRNRFPQSFQETFTFFHEKFYGTQPTQENLDRFFSIGDEVFRIVPEPIENIQNVLSLLRERGDVLYMLTAGEEDVQRYKIDNNPFLYEFFADSHIFIRINKGVDEFQEVYDHMTKNYGHVPKENVTMIGDSQRSDIAPSLAFSFNAVHIDVSTWSHNHFNVEGDYVVVKDLFELEEYFKQEI